MSFALTDGENALLQLTQEWKTAKDAADQARQRLIPAVRALYNDGRGSSMRDIAKLMEVALGTVQKLLS